ISFAGAATGSSIIRFRNPSDSTDFDIVAGTHYCNPSCGDGNSSAASLADYINNDTGFIGNTFSAVYGGANSLVIRANSNDDDDDADDTPHAIQLGNIHITNGTDLLLPYLDGTRSNQVSIFRVTPIS